MTEIEKSVFDEIKATIGAQIPERGGVLGAKENMPISHFYFGKTAAHENNSYTPDILSINRVLSEEWQPLGVQLVGIIHSHDSSCDFTSCGDLYYAERLLKANDTLKSLLMPIVCVNPFCFL